MAAAPVGVSAKRGEGSMSGEETFGRRRSRRQSQRHVVVRSQRHAVMERVAYFMDRVLSKRWSFLFAMSSIGLFMVGAFGALTALLWECASEESMGLGREGQEDACDERSKLIEGVWIAWTFMADPGTHAGVGRPVNRVLGSVITMGGILFMASILGVTVDMVREKMDALRQGKSNIVEHNHTLILGWTDKTMHIIEELIDANASEDGGVVCVLAPETKEHMEAELAIKVPVGKRKRTRVILRNGSPLVLGDLVRVSVHTARAIIVLASAGDADRADADTLRTMLSIQTLSHMIQGHVVAEVRDIDNEPLISMVGGDVPTDTLVSHDMIGRLMLLSARQPGLAKVYEALLGFEGDEFYKEAWPELEGLAFRELHQRFPDAVPIGIYRSGGMVCLLPPGSYVLKDGDQVIVLAEDNDTYKPQPPHVVQPGPPPAFNPPARGIEKILFCGWRRDIRDVLHQLDKLVEPGSEVHMMTHCVPLHLREECLLEDGLDVTELANILIVHHYGNTSVRRKLESLPIDTYTSCKIFADQAFEADTMQADSHSLATLLLIRDIQAGHGRRRSTEDAAVAAPAPSEGEDVEGGSNNPERKTRSSMKPNPHFRMLQPKPLNKRMSQLRAKQCPIICEILDPHTQRTIADSKQLSLASDFCQTNRFIAQVMTMVAEDRTVKALLDELLGSQGVSIAVVPSERYMHAGEELNFFGVASRALHLGEIVIGYQLRSSIEATTLNPPNKHQTFAWDGYDFAILERGVHPQEEALDGWVNIEEPSFEGIWSKRLDRSDVREKARERRSLHTCASDSSSRSRDQLEEDLGSEQARDDAYYLMVGSSHKSKHRVEAPIPEEVDDLSWWRPASEGSLPKSALSCGRRAKGLAHKPEGVHAVAG